MNLLLQQLRQLPHRAARLIERSAPYLLAGDPSRPPPPALWLDAWRQLNPRDDGPAGPAPARVQPGALVCCPHGA